MKISLIKKNPDLQTWENFVEEKWNLKQKSVFAHKRKFSAANTALTKIRFDVSVSI